MRIRRGCKATFFSFSSEFLKHTSRVSLNESLFFTRNMDFFSMSYTLLRSNNKEIWVNFWHWHSCFHNDSDGGDWNNISFIF